MWLFADAFGNLIGDQISYDTASITVSAIPVPAAIWLFLSGFVALVGCTAKK